MPIPTGFQKAAIEIDGEQPINCYFNPTEYSISKSNQWKYDPVTGTTLPKAQFGGGNSAVPPFVTFHWGSVVSFKAVCTQLTVAFKVFHPNGEPIRADVKMSLKQAETASTASSTGANRPGNPTTRANAGHGVHTVKDGDTLPSIAYQTYGDATVWRAIAQANDIENPLHLRRGRPLSLPKLEG